ncbi:ankyrin repeat and protein kinase domain-containing protein 1 [Stigmatopora nigra]
MDYSDASSGQIKSFKKNDFENDWTKVAEGKFSNVYRVKIKIWRETCALKVYDTTVPIKHLYREPMEEVSEIAKVKFKYLVSVYGMCNDVPGIVMEFMNNGSLCNLLNNTNLLWPKKFQMIHEVCKGLNFLHCLKPPLFHLNLKPSNVLLDDHLHVKISDFGVIHWEEGMDKRSFLEHLTARGNLKYVPPEIFNQLCDPPGFPFDVYSFGILIWEILTQRKPYAGFSTTTVLLNVSHGCRPSLEIIPEQRPRECDEMISIMKWCWQQEENKRPPFSEIMRKTEAQSELLRIPGPMYCPENCANECTVEAQQPIFSTYEISPPELSDPPAGEQCSKETVLSLLLRKNFCNFRTSVKREHVSTHFHGKKSLLHYTVASGDAKSVEHVLSLGADVNYVMDKGYTPLIVAVLNRLHNIISLLLKHGADPMLGDEDRWTAVHFAAQNGDDKAVRLLLDNGASAGACEKSGWTPLHLACQNGHEPVVRLLLTRLSVNAMKEREEVQGRTPLHLAASYGHVNIAMLLLTRGANPNASDSSLLTPLHLSAEAGHNRIVRNLVNNGAVVDSTDQRGRSPLHLAALNGHKGICRQLLTNGANPDCRTQKGWTAMHLATMKRHGPTVEELKSLGASVNALGEKRWTALHLACHQSEADMVAKLLAAQADPNVTEDGQGWTPLHLACASISFPSVLHLISHQAKVNATSADKATPLHLAALHGNVSIVKALLLNGADVSLRDSSGLKPVEVAQKYGRDEIVQLLEE